MGKENYKESLVFVMFGFFSVVTPKSVYSPKRLVSFPLFFFYFNLLFEYRVMLGTSHLTQLCF